MEGGYEKRNVIFSLSLQDLKTRKIFLYVLALLVPGIIGYWFYSKSGKSSSHPPLPPNRIHNWKDGDIIMRYGRGYVSDGIVGFLHEPFAVSHCGIIHPSKDGIRVIHSDSRSGGQQEGTFTVDLEDFVRHSKPGSIMVVRYRHIDSAAQARIVASALDYARRHTPFDYAFDAETDSALFCTELVWKSYQKAGIRNIFPERNHQVDLLQFRCLYDTTVFSILYNEHDSLP